MAIKSYLAMTAAEFESASNLPVSIAWMACHFSPYATGLSNIPRTLPDESLIILNDITPIHKHDPKAICAELKECAESLHCSAVLLDFQRLPNPELYELSKILVRALPCPVVLPELLAVYLDSPVFLPPCPLYMPLQDHIRKWKDRDIWLEIAHNTNIIVVNEKGTVFSSEKNSMPKAKSFTDGTLHCHYTVNTTLHDATFHLWRTKEDYEAFLQYAELLGIHHTVGLYQEFQNDL